MASAQARMCSAMSLTTRLAAPALSSPASSAAAVRAAAEGRDAGITLARLEDVLLGQASGAQRVSS